MTSVIPFHETKPFTRQSKKYRRIWCPRHSLTTGLRCSSHISPAKESATRWIRSTPGIFTAMSTNFRNKCKQLKVIGKKLCSACRVIHELLTVSKNPSAIHWNMEDGYNLSADRSEIYPHRMFGYDFSDTLFVVVKSFNDESNKHCSKFAQGFLFALHPPDELARVPRDFIQIPMGQSIYISIRPNMITTSNGLRRYSPRERGCLFKAERQLRFFKSYSQRNCELECLTNYTESACDCVQFWMPSE